MLRARVTVHREDNLRRGMGLLPERHLRERGE